MYDAYVKVKSKKKLVTLLDLCVSSLRRGHANLLCIVPILTDGNPEGNPIIIWRYSSSAYLSRLNKGFRQPTGTEKKLSAP